MFDEGTNAVTMNLPKRVENHKLELEKQLNVAHIEPKYDNVDGNIIDSELTNFADSVDKKGK